MRAWRAAWVVPLVLGLGGGACWLHAALDAAALRRFVRTVIDPQQPPDDQILALTRWIYESRPSAQNPSGFVFRSLGATPLQVLTRGGDCADKARLLTALADSLNLDATPVMLFDPHNGKPVHTVVEVEYAEGRRFVVDPSYDLHFPHPEGGYHDVMSLRRAPQVATTRIREAVGTSPWPARIHFRNLPDCDYATASTFNWNGGALRRLAFMILHGFYGDEVYHLRRPAFLENPAVAVGMMLFGSSVGASLLLLIVLRLMPRSRRSSRRAIPLVTPERFVRYPACGQPQSLTAR